MQILKKSELVKFILNRLSSLPMEDSTAWWETPSTRFIKHKNSRMQDLVKPLSSSGAAIQVIMQ